MMVGVVEVIVVVIVAVVVVAVVIVMIVTVMVEVGEKSVSMLLPHADNLLRAAPTSNLRVRMPAYPLQKKNIKGTNAASPMHLPLGPRNGLVTKASIPAFT